MVSVIKDITEKTFGFEESQIECIFSTNDRLIK